MLHKTEGLVLRTVKYRESSVVATIYTELFGTQSYLIKGVRAASAKRHRANILQPGNLLELIVYHQEQKNLQQLSEFRLAFIYQSIQADMVKNAVAIFLLELLQHSLHQPEAHPELFSFVKNTFHELDRCEKIAANLPLYFTLKLGSLLGFGLNGHHSTATPYLDFQEGYFVIATPHHPWFLDAYHSEITSRFLEVKETSEIATVSLNKTSRRRLLYAYLEYFRLHLPDFRELKSPPILQEILEE